MRVEQITIRRGGIDDAGALAELFTHTRRTCMPYLPKLHTPDEDRDWMRNVVFSHCEVWVALVGGVVAGFVAVEGDLLEHLYVDSQFHGRGVGSMLLAKARELCPNGFRLWVFQQNAPARRFYESAACTSCA